MTARQKKLISSFFSFRNRQARNLIGLCLFLLLGCSVATIRPLQEMSNADAAIRAAKDVSADSLVPELFRSANENYFKAKREYKLKNFDAAKTYALRATKLAEKAEFEAFKLGGATPETANLHATPEGALPDSETSLKAHSRSAHETKSTESPQEEKTKTAKEEPKANEGTDYYEYLRQMEAEKQRAEAEKNQGSDSKEGEKKEKSSSEKKTEGPLGPPPILLSQNESKGVGRTEQDTKLPQTSGLPPAIGGAAVSGGQGQIQDAASQPSSLRASDMVWSPRESRTPEMKDLGKSSPELMAQDKVQTIGEVEKPIQVGLEPMSKESPPVIQPKTLEPLVPESQEESR